MPYLLDTNIWIQYLKIPDSAIHHRLQTLQPADIVTCSIIRSELLHGAQKYGNSMRRKNTVESTLAPFRSVPFDDLDAEFYATLRHELETAGNDHWAT